MVLVGSRDDGWHAGLGGLEQQITSAIDYKGRLRSQQAKIASKEGRTNLWSDG
jgi:hypothetical protein